MCEWETVRPYLRGYTEMLSVRALTYRLERIHRLTGADPADPTHRYTLQTAVIGARLLDWPAREL